MCWRSELDEDMPVGHLALAGRHVVMYTYVCNTDILMIGCGSTLNAGAAEHLCR